MTTKNKWLLGSSILLTIYFLASIPYYLIEGATQLEGHPIFGALYLGFIFVHEAIVLLALLLQWGGYANGKRGPIILASLLLLVATAELFILLVPIIVLLPIVIVNLIAGPSKQRT